MSKYRKLLMSYFSREKEPRFIIVLIGKIEAVHKKGFMPVNNEHDFHDIKKCTRGNAARSGLTIILGTGDF